MRIYKNMKRARTSGNTTDNSSATTTAENNDDVQVRTTEEEFSCSVPNFSSIFPNVLVEGEENHLKFNLIGDKKWPFKQFFGSRSMMMAEMGSRDEGQSEGMAGALSINPSLRAGGTWLGGLLIILLDCDQAKVYKEAGAAAMNRLVSLKAAVVDKTGIILYEGSRIPRQKILFSSDPARITLKFFIAPLKTLWENREFYFPNDLLHLKIVLNTRSDAAAAGDELMFVPQGYKGLSDDMLGMFRSGEGADFKIVCEGTKFPVHKAILACRSQVFSRMLATDMKEKASHSLNVHDVEPTIMKLLLEYIYSSKIELHSLDFEAVLDLGASADKYQILKLKDLCFSYATDRIDLKTAGQLAVILHKHSANNGIRSKVFDYCAVNWKELCSQEKFQVLVEAHPTAFVNKKP